MLVETWLVVASRWTVPSNKMVVNRMVKHHKVRWRYRKITKKRKF